jgi:hypothetical protein
MLDDIRRQLAARLQERLQEETEWLRARRGEWSKERLIPQGDLQRVFEMYFPLLLAASGQRIRHIDITMESMGRTGVHWIRELVHWELDGAPEQGAVLVVMEGAKREAMRVAANSARIMDFSFEIN